MLLSEISSVLPNATGWSYVTCSVLTVFALDAVRRVCFGVLYSRSSFWFLPHGGKFLGVWPCRLKYDWALILRVICHPVASLPDFRCFEMACSSHLWGCFIPLRCECFQTQVHSFVMVCSIGSYLRFVCSGQGGSRQRMSSSIICHL